MRDQKLKANNDSFAAVHALRGFRRAARGLLAEAPGLVALKTAERHG